MMSTLIADYHRTGFAFLRAGIAGEELKALRHAGDACLADESHPGRVNEGGTNAPRAVHGAHLTHPVMRALCRHPATLGVAHAILGEEAYVHQFKLNVKSAFVGDVWEWHQDFTFYHREDEIPRPDIVTAAVFLDDVDEFNAPLVFIPESHGSGFADSERRDAGDVDAEMSWMSNTTARLRYVVRHDLLAKLVSTHGLESATGRAGDIVFFGANLFHASGVNITPFDRRIAFISYNAASNVPRETRPPRPEFLCARDRTPLPVEPGAMLR